MLDIGPERWYKEGMLDPAAATAPIVSEISVRIVERGEESRYQAQMAAQHYLGALPKIGETLWYVATWRGRWPIRAVSTVACTVPRTGSSWA